MAGESDDINNDTDQEFRFASLEFADATNQPNYAHYQRQILNNKTLHMCFLTKNKTELTNTLKKTRTDTLLKMIQIEKEYIVNQSQAKVDNIVENNREFSTFVTGVDFNYQQIQGFEAHIDKENREALEKHLAFVEEVDNMTQNFQPSPAPATSSEGASSSPRFVNRPDLAEGCTQLSEESNYKETLDFLERVENWYSGTWPGCSDTNKMKKEIYNKLSPHLKTELVDFDVNTNTYDELKKSIMARIERKYPSKIRLLSFLTETKQQGTQTLSEYLTLAHREAAEAGLYSQGWTISDLEVIILLAGMKNIGQHQRLLLEYSNKNKITFEEALKFATVEETAERQAMKGKSSSVNSIKQGGKAKAKNPNQKPAATAKESEKKKCEKCPSYRHKTEDCTSTFCNYCKRWFHTIESCKLNPNSPSYSPTFEAERNKKKPTATVNSIQHAQQQQTGSLMPPPSNLFQERNQLNTPPPQYLPASPSQPALVTALLQQGGD